MRIQVDEGAGITAHGSGVLYRVDGDHGWVVTNHHVIKDARGSVSVLFANGRHYIATVIDSNKVLDLAKLEIKNPQVKPRIIADMEPKNNERCWIIGFGGGVFGSQEGRVMGFMGRESESMKVVGIRARQGDSGGAIINGRGHLVGILNASSDPRDTAFTIGCRLGRLRRFLGLGSKSRPITIGTPIVQDDSQIAKLQASITELREAITAMQVKPGPKGDAGKNAEIDYEKLVEAMATDGRFRGRDGTSPIVESSGISHMVIVADQDASSWPRLQAEIEAAQAAYHKIVVEPLGDASIGQIPVIVEYESGSPYGRVAGLRDVSIRLALIARGEYPNE